MVTTRESYYDVLTAAINYFDEHGYDSAEALTFWVLRLRQAAEAELIPPHVLEQNLRDTLGMAYRRLVEDGGILKQHPGVSLFTLNKVRPELRAELDRRILASASLIKLNRDAAIEKTLQRFQGWATSIPVGGAAKTDKPDTKANIRKSMAALPFEERRVLIDQGHKLGAAVNDIVAKGGGAIAGVWQSHYRQANYNFRKDHAARDGNVYLIPDTWATQQGLVRPSSAGWSNKITQPAEEPFCRCWFKYRYNLRDLPESMLTVKGRATLADIRAKVMAS